MIVPARDSAYVNGQLAAVIVTYNRAAVLGYCVRSLVDQGTRLAAVVVADNASTDKTCHIAENFAGLSVQVIDLGLNAGFAAGVNAGIAALDLTRLDAVLILNPDCQVQPGALPALALALRQSGSGVAVPRLVNPNGAMQPPLRRKPTVGRALVESLLRRRGNRQHSAAYFAAVAVGESIRAAAGRPTSRASIAALLQPLRRVTELAS
jgi:N-acetylglucosaminyl-diphospho-decaprenol L-rhamnosyltransferase